ncbi:WD40-repeat-containing domain protein [Suillus ampliporus]|nr:WD40-repeat-containing domain protein [Suillus ampliporus]
MLTKFESKSNHIKALLVTGGNDYKIKVWHLAILTGHSHCVMSAQFHPKDDFIISMSMDQTNKPNNGPNNFEMFETFSTVKYVLEGHNHGVNWASFHPMLPLIVSAADDQTIKIWRMSKTRAWRLTHAEVTSTACQEFHPKHELIVSCAEDRIVQV